MNFSWKPPEPPTTPLHEIHVHAEKETSDPTAPKDFIVISMSFSSQNGNLGTEGLESLVAARDSLRDNGWQASVTRTVTGQQEYSEDEPS